ncbi:MAG: hypothetical protein IKX20_01925 [Paludibacteraceae bacterium]|nr:hypothetical protein [Paludibacteraceae bacterium]
MKKTRIISLAFVLVMICVVSVALAADYVTPSTMPLGAYTVTIENRISENQKNASAKTWAPNPNVGTSVTATFYWFDTEYDNGDGTYGRFFQQTKTFGNYGSATVVADTLTGVHKYYYKVISNHYASYGGESVSHNGLKTELR